MELEGLESEGLESRVEVGGLKLRGLGSGVGVGGGSWSQGLELKG